MLVLVPMLIIKIELMLKLTQEHHCHHW